MATYEEIRKMCLEICENRKIAYVKDCHIAHAKEILGVPKRPRKTNLPRVHPCPPESLPILREAFKTLGMLP